MDSVEIKEEECPKEILNMLKDVDRIPNFLYYITYTYFYEQKKLDYLSSDEKCMMAYFLSQVDIDLVDEDEHDYNSMKYDLFNYYLANYDSCSVKAKEEMMLYDSKMIKKRSLRKKVNQEDYVRLNCPDIYEELMILRKENELLREKTFYK